MTDILFQLFIFFSGTIAGSFLNMLIDRLPRGEDIVFRRSHCDKCKHELAVIDLFPVFSYLLLGGRCRYCRKKIPPRNLMVELITGSGFLLISGYYGFISPAFTVLQIAIFCILTAIFFIDLTESIIPDALTLILIIVTLVIHLLFNINGLGPDVLAGISFLLFFLLLVIITKGKGMGIGDVKFAFFMGFYLGFKNLLVAFYLAFLTGALISLILVYKRRKTFGSAIPFGPFLVFATLAGQYFGLVILNFVSRLFF